MNTIKNKAQKLNNILIINGNIIDTKAGKTFRSDIMIENGIIRKVEKKIKVSENDKKLFKIIDADNLLICPGFFDMHVHLRDPGYEYKEDISSGINSAIRGGITSLACMPNTSPVIDVPFLVKYLKMSALINDYNIYPVAAITRNLEGEVITEFGLLKEAGAVAFSDDGRGIQNSRLMYEIMKYAAQMDTLLILHEEDYSFSENGVVHDGSFSAAKGLEGISNLSEDIMIARDLILAKKTGARIHLTHLSSAASVNYVRMAKKDNIRVTCDVTPEHFFFNDECIKDFDTNFKIKPPIRSENDRRSIIEGIKDGTIDAIASDHAPHSEAEKNISFNEAAFGSIGLETLFKASMTKLYREEKISLERVIELISSSPSKIIGVRENVIKEGELANISITDVNCLGKYSKEMIVSKSRNSSFLNTDLYGDVIYTIVNGCLRFINTNRCQGEDFS